MKKRMTVFMAVIIALCFMLPAMAIGADKIISLEVASVTTNVDKNGAPYARVICNEKRSLQGTEYETGIAIMAFRDLVDPVSKLVKGSVLKAIVSEREFQGRKSYTILKLLP